MSGPSFNDNQQQQHQKSNMNNMKKNLTLDFNQAKLNLNNNTFTPTDLNMLKVDTPELNLLKVDTPTIENIILANGLPNTPSPSLLFPRTVTAEQETFAGGFVEALNNLHNNGNSQNSSDTNSSIFSNNNTTNNSTSNNNNEQTHFAPLIKEEPQTVPNITNNSNNNNNNNSSSNNVNTPPMSPVDMEFQERMKLERKRQRNRLAASKCRSRKLERISKLEDKVKQLKSENTELGSVINQLKEHVGLLKLEVMEHANAGCPIMGTTY